MLAPTLIPAPNSTTEDNKYSRLSQHRPYQDQVSVSSPKVAEAQDSPALPGGLRWVTVEVKAAGQTHTGSHAII